MLQANRQDNGNVHVWHVFEVDNIQSLVKSTIFVSSESHLPVKSAVAASSFSNHVSFSGTNVISRLELPGNNLFP